MTSVSPASRSAGTRKSCASASLRRRHSQCARTTDRGVGQPAHAREMAGTPLLLTMLARVNLRGRLPEGRAELYGECTNQLLWEWEKLQGARGRRHLREPANAADHRGRKDALHRRPGAPALGDDLPRPRAQRPRRCGTARRRSGEAPGQTAPQKIWRQGLGRTRGRPHRERGGLLLASDNDTFTYPHRSFQEYLAARWLLEEPARNELAAQKATSDIWREVVLLACGHLTRRRTLRRTQALVAELAGGRFNNDEDRRRLLVAGQAWLEFGPEKATGYVGTELRRRSPDCSPDLMQDRTALPSATAGSRPNRSRPGHLPDDLDAFVPPLSAKVGRRLRHGQISGHQRAISPFLG